MRVLNAKPHTTSEVDTLLCANCINTQIIETTTISVSTNVNKNLQQVNSISKCYYSTIL